MRLHPATVDVIARVGLHERFELADNVGKKLVQILLFPFRSDLGVG